MLRLDIHILIFQHIFCATLLSDPLPAYMWPKSEPGFSSCANLIQHNLAPTDPVLTPANPGTYTGVELSPQGLVPQPVVMPHAPTGLEATQNAELPIPVVMPAPIDQGIPGLLISPQMLPCKYSRSHLLALIYQAAVCP